jgi:hypothetical protein
MPNFVKLVIFNILIKRAVKQCNIYQSCILLLKKEAGWENDIVGNTEDKKMSLYLL